LSLTAIGMRGVKKYILLILTHIAAYAFCFSQVPVRNEPRHHNIFDNGTVRILDVHIPPGDTTQFHIHATPSVFLTLSNRRTGSEVISEEVQSTSPIPHYGNIWFEGFYKQPRIHRVWNRDTAEFNVMDIELTKKNHIIIDSPIRESGFGFLFEEIPVRAYRLTLIPRQKIFLGERKADMLIIQLSDDAARVLVNQKYLRGRGDFVFIPGRETLSLINEKDQTAEFAFFELK
jgi:hypothetical protein